MPEFYIADVRKRVNTDSNMAPQAIPEKRVFGEDESESGDYRRLTEIFSADAEEISDDPVVCGLKGCDGITMEWTTGGSFGQIDFYAAALGEDESQRFLSLYIFSGNKPEEDRVAMRQLEQYADFAQCVNFPLVLQVVDDPLGGSWKHAALQAVRPGITSLAGAFLTARSGAEKSSPKV